MRIWRYVYYVVRYYVAFISSYFIGTYSFRHCECGTYALVGSQRWLMLFWGKARPPDTNVDDPFVGGAACGAAPQSQIHFKLLLRLNPPRAAVFLLQIWRCPKDRARNPRQRQRQGCLYFLFLQFQQRRTCDIYPLIFQIFGF